AGVFADEQTAALSPATGAGVEAGVMNGRSAITAEAALGEIVHKGALHERQGAIIEDAPAEGGAAIAAGRGAGGIHPASPLSTPSQSLANDALEQRHRARVVDAAAEGPVAARARPLIDTPGDSVGAIAPLGGAPVDDHVVECGGGRAQVQDAAAGRGGGARHSSHAEVRGVPVADRQVAADGRDGAEHLENPVEGPAVEDRLAGAGPLDRDPVTGPGQVEVTLRRGILLAGGVGHGELVGPGPEIDRVVLAVGIGLDDGIPQGTLAAV